MNKGIYAYFDKENHNKVVYIGKSIDLERREKDHLIPSKYNHQQINKILQNNPERYEFKIIKYMNKSTLDELNQSEINYINLLNPKFNFSKGGDGCDSGKDSPSYRHDLNRDKIIEDYKKGLSIRQTSEKHNCGYGTVQRILKKHNCKIRTLSESNSGENHIWYDKKLPKEVCEKMSNSRKGKYGKEKNPAWDENFINDLNSCIDKGLRRTKDLANELNITRSALYNKLKMRNLPPPTQYVNQYLNIKS